MLTKDTNKAPTIHYNTNGNNTHDKEFADTVLSKFKFVDVMFSIDGIMDSLNIADIQE